MHRYIPALLLSLVALPWGRAGAAGEYGYRTGGAHDVMVTSTPTEGLEVGIPRNSWYAKGIALDMQQRWDESFNAYEKARREYSQQQKRRPRWEKMVRGWKLKAEFQLNQSRQLRTQRYYRWRSRHRRMNLYKAMALHNKWLGIRAFTGQSSPKLRDKVIEAYKEVIRRSSYDDRPKIQLAAMYHELGKHEEARRWFAKARYVTRTYMAQQVAYYYAAAGKVDKAFEHVERAVKYSSSNRRRFLMSNDLDRLRADPRFRKLVGEP